MIFGTTYGLRFVFNENPTNDSPVLKTWGDMQLWIGNTLIWGHHDEAGNIVPFEWSWFEMLEFLADAWPYLHEEETTPILFEELTDLKYLLSELHSRWITLSDEQQEEEDELIQDFLAVHDLSRGVEGAWPESVILLRQGNKMLSSSSGKTWWLDFQETMQTLENLGNYLAGLLTDCDNERASVIVNRWEKHHEITELQKTIIATGWSENHIRSVFPVNDTAYHPCLRAVARMTLGKIPDASIKTILESVNTISYRTNTILDNLPIQAKYIIQDYRLRPFEQGNKLANLLRDFLENPFDSIDVEKLLKSWGVTLIDIEFDQGIDAVAVWGAKNESAILINTEGHRSKYPTGRRFTLAHEICHLLVDKEGALPFADVVGGRVYKPVEQRANAFAAELLLPLHAVKNFIDKNQGIYELEDIINKLAELYDVSHEMSAWQYQKVTNISRETINTYIKSIHDPY